MPYLPEMTLTNYLYQEKMEEEDVPALRTAQMYKYKDSKNTLKKAKKI